MHHHPTEEIASNWQTPKAPIVCSSGFPSALKEKRSIFRHKSTSNDSNLRVWIESRYFWIPSESPAEGIWMTGSSPERLLHTWMELKSSIPFSLSAFLLTFCWSKCFCVWKWISTALVAWASSEFCRSSRKTARSQSQSGRIEWVGPPVNSPEYRASTLSVRSRWTYSSESTIIPFHVWVNPAPKFRRGVDSLLQINLMINI